MFTLYSFLNFREYYYRQRFHYNLNFVLQKFDILEGDLPETTTDVVVTGAETVMFGANSLTRLKDARQIHVSDSGILLMSKFAAVNLNVVSVYLEIANIELVRIEERAFSNIKGMF